MLQHTITEQPCRLQASASRPDVGKSDGLKSRKESNKEFSKEVVKELREELKEATGSRYMLTDEQIMAAIAGGDQRIYADTVRQHSRAIAYYAFRMLSSQSGAEDVAQETFLRLWTHADRWQPDKAGISTWLHRIAHNLCIDTLRKDRSGITDELQDETEDTQAAVEQKLETEQRQHRLQQALSMLPERQRSALILTHYQGLSNQAVATIMDLSVDALESLLARTRRALKTSLTDLQSNNSLQQQGAKAQRQELT
ncbi:MAG: RNA polymerase sigma factor [Pseudohongiella sp.]|nr:RNA polymerase sigma factor [Pseudohongiella sp.]MDP2128439.1 RNA polymerase sigma factor [Pseudohongiella sp.]